MHRTYTSEIQSHIGESVKLQGWVSTIRDQGKIIFIILRDIHGSTQCVVTTEHLETFEQTQKLTTESVVEIIGLVKEEKQAPDGVEILVSEIKVLSLAAPVLPIPISEKAQNEAELSTRLDWRWIDLRKPENALIFKIWTTFEQAFIEFCIARGFIEIHSPKTVITSTESGSELFEIKYFDTKAYLAQSPQLYKQMAMAAGMEKVFEIGPVFRANPSFTSRHDTEFTMFDIEISFIESHYELIQLEEEMMQYIFTKVKEKHGTEITKYFSQEITIPQRGIPKLTLHKAKEILKSLQIPNERGDDLSPEEERALSQYILEKEGSEFVFIYDWPTSVRAFYSMRDEHNPAITKSFDLLYKGIEVTSGAQREHRPEQLKKQIIEQGLSLDAFESYINFFTYGCPPHGGFAPGPSRIIMKMLGLSNVREVTYLYRGVKRITP